MEIKTISWDVMPKSVRNHFEKFLISQDFQEKQVKIVSDDEIIEIILQMPPIIRLPIMAMGIAELANRFIPSKDHQKFLDDFVLTVKKFIQEKYQEHH